MPTFGDIERALPSLYEYRWFIALGAILLGAAFTYLFISKGWHQYLLDHRVPFALGGVPVALMGLFLAWSLASPLFLNVTVEEEFPFAAQATVPEGMERAEIEAVFEAMAMVDAPEMSEAMPDGPAMVASSMMMAGTPVTAIETEAVSDMMDGFAMGAIAEDEESMAQASEMIAPAVSAVVEQQGETIALRAGAFRDADTFHRGSGDATIYSAPGGGLVLRLEDLNVTNGPALHVILSPHPDPVRSSDVLQPGYVDLGRLKGNRGDQNYTIPAGLDVSTIGSVVIYCKPFAVVFSVATLNDA